VIKKFIYLFFILFITNFNAFSMKRSHDESEAPFDDTYTLSSSFEKLSLEEAEETVNKIIVTRFGQLFIEIKHSPSPKELQETVLPDLDNLIQTIDNLKFPALIKWIRSARQEIATLFDFDLPLDFIKEQINKYFDVLLNQCNTYLAQNKREEEPVIICPQPLKLVPDLDKWFGYAQ
jgi:hypothetical protein